MSTPVPYSPGDFLQRWLKEVARARYAHYEAARHYNHWNFIVGLPAVALSAIVGSTIFASLEREVDLAFKIAVGLLSISASVLTALQTFLSLSAKSEKHRIIGSRYGAIRREIERLLAGGADAQEELAELEKRMNNIGMEAPTVPLRIWAQASKKFELES